MSWFGAFFLGVMGINKVSDSIRRKREDNKSKQRATSFGSDTYYDSYGAERLISSGQHVSVERNNMGDRVIKATNGAVLKREINPRVSELSEKLNAELKEHNVPLKYYCRYCDKYDRWDGPWHQADPNAAILVDSNGEEYFFKRFNLPLYFIRLSDGKRVYMGNYKRMKGRDSWIEQYEKDSIEYKKKYGKFSFNYANEQRWIAYV